MKKEVKKLREKSINSLILSIEHFNRPWDCGRVEAVLILLDHAFEMLLKAAIRERSGKIQNMRERGTISFTNCINIGLSGGNLKFLTPTQAKTLKVINGLRNAAQHYFLDLSEHQLYIYAQAGVTLFRDIHDGTFAEKLLIHLPERVLPVSTTVPNDLTVLFDKEIEEIKRLLRPGTRQKIDATAKVRGLAVLERAINDIDEQPNENELNQICENLYKGDSWASLFPGVASIKMITKHEGPSLSLRLTKNEGIPVRLLKEGEHANGVVALKRVNELDYYSLGAQQLAEKVGLTAPKCFAVVEHLKLREDPDCFKKIKIGKAVFGRYSPMTIARIRSALDTYSVDDIWREHRSKQKNKKL